MSKQRLTLQEIPTLKRLAKTIKRDLKISHSEALNQIAVQYGYSAWSQLHSEAVDSKVDTRAYSGERERPYRLNVNTIFLNASPTGVFTPGVHVQSIS